MLAGAAAQRTSLAEPSTQLSHQLLAWHEGNAFTSQLCAPLISAKLGHQLPTSQRRRAAQFMIRVALTRRPGPVGQRSPRGQRGREASGRAPRRSGGRYGRWGPLRPLGATRRGGLLRSRVSPSPQPPRPAVRPVPPPRAGAGVEARQAGHRGSVPPRSPPPAPAAARRRVPGKALGAARRPGGASTPPPRRVPPPPQPRAASARQRRGRSPTCLPRCRDGAAADGRPVARRAARPPRRGTLPRPAPAAAAPRQVRPGSRGRRQPGPGPCPLPSGGWGCLHRAGRGRGRSGGGATPARPCPGRGELLGGAARGAGAGTRGEGKVNGGAAGLCAGLPAPKRALKSCWVGWWCPGRGSCGASAAVGASSPSLPLFFYF